jgi:hypothetical protein
VSVASSHERAEKPAKEWLLIEWPEGEDEPTKYWLSTLPKSISLRDLVDAAKLRWRIERDYQELKQEVGLGHYGRQHIPLEIAALVDQSLDRPNVGPWVHMALSRTHQQPLASLDHKARRGNTSFLALGRGNTDREIQVSSRALPRLPASLPNSPCSSL